MTSFSLEVLKNSDNIKNLKHLDFKYTGLDSDSFKEISEFKCDLQYLSLLDSLNIYDAEIESLFSS